MPNNMGLDEQARDEELRGRINKRVKEMEAEDSAGKLSRRDLKKRWETHNLRDSLYNTDQHGSRLPKVSDIDQSSASDLDYLFEGSEIEDCYLLANLMGLAQCNPRYITSELIKIVGKDEVKVGFFEYEFSRITKSDGSERLKCAKKGSRRKYYSVKKPEALKWKTSHLALWPVVIEIAFAKFLRDEMKKHEDLKNIFRDSLSNSLQKN